MQPTRVENGLLFSFKNMLFPPPPPPGCSRRRHSPPPPPPPPVAGPPPRLLSCRLFTPVPIRSSPLKRHLGLLDFNVEEAGLRSRDGGGGLSSRRRTGEPEKPRLALQQAARSGNQRRLRFLVLGLVQPVLFSFESLGPGQQGGRGRLGCICYCCPIAQGSVTQK